MRILLVEDDTMIGESVLDCLRAEHYAVDWVRDGHAAELALRTDPYDLVLLDLGLPRRDGLSLLRDLRGRKDRTPVLIATARDAVSDRIAGLDAGADDYIVKPLRPLELLARVAALLRRSQIAEPADESFDVAAYRIEPAARTILLDGAAVALAPKEFELALLFFRNLGRLMSRDVLAECVWNREIPATSRTLDTHLSNIRQKLQLRPEHGVRLSSSYALGYRLELTSASEDSPPSAP